MSDKLDENIENINSCFDAVSETLHNIIKQDRTPTPDEAAMLIHAASFVAATLTVRATETAHSVGRLATALEKLVEINERDFKAAVNAEADVKSDMKREEETKRSFIGQKRN